MWERLTAPEDGFSKLQRENIVIIESYGKALMDVVCRDACDGHEISRVRGTQQQTHLITNNKQLYDYIDRILFLTFLFYFLTVRCWLWQFWTAFCP